MTISRAQAVVFESPQKVAFREVEIPDLGNDGILVRTEWSLLSTGTELSFLKGERVSGETPAIPDLELPFPQVPGYQRVGIVEKTGKSVTRFRVGDRVFAALTPVLGMKIPRGGHVSLGCVSESEAIKLPEGFDPVEASGLVLTQVGYNCASRFDIRPGEAALVMGDGLVGLWTAQTLMARNAVVFLVGRHVNRMKHMALSFPHAALVESNDSSEELVKHLEKTECHRLKAIIDTVGHNGHLMKFYEYLEKEGHLVSAGFLGSSGAIDIQKLRPKEATLHSPSGWTTQRLDATLNLLRLNKLRLSPLVSHRFQASDAPKAYDMILKKKEDFLAILFDWRSL